MEHLGRWASVDVTGRLDSVENIYIYCRKMPRCQESCTRYRALVIHLQDGFSLIQISVLGFLVLSEVHKPPLFAGSLELPKT